MEKFSYRISDRIKILSFDSYLLHNFANETIRSKYFYDRVIDFERSYD